MSSWAEFVSTAAEVSWELPDGPFTYFRGQLDGAPAPRPIYSLIYRTETTWLDGTEPAGFAKPHKRQRYSGSSYRTQEVAGSSPASSITRIRCFSRF
jgi:hypothetical protein